jgi:hypothetical protein
MSRPAAIVERRLHRLGAVVCGWNGIRHAHKQAAYPLEYNDLLPDGSLKMNGVRFYGSADPGRVVAVTAALLEADGKGLTALFAQLPRSRSKAGFTVQDFAGHNGGISGTVNGQQVLFGTAEFMQEQDLALPDVGNVEFALYAALDSQVSAVFVLSCRRSRTAAAGLRMLSSDRNVVPVLTACDFLLTPKFLRTQLGMSAKRLYLLPRQQREILAQQQPADDAPVIALVTKTNLAARAGALNSARGLRSALRTGAMIHILGGLVGLLAVTVLSLIGAQDLLTPSNLLVYQALWSLPGLLITEWVRY